MSSNIAPNLLPLDRQRRQEQRALHEISALGSELYSLSLKAAFHGEIQSLGNAGSAKALLALREELLRQADRAEELAIELTMLAATEVEDDA